jgi:hypothetical protein
MFPLRRRNLREERDSHHHGQRRSNARLAVIPLRTASKQMNRRKPTYFRNAMDLKDKVQVRILRKRLKLSPDQFSAVVRKAGNSISAITKEAGR